MIRLAFVLAVLVAGACPAWAGPVTILADHLDVWNNKKQALFTGNVYLKRDDLELFCDKLRVFYTEKNGIEHAVAKGHVRIRQGDKRGHADKAELDNQRQILTLTGHAVMEQPGGRIEGETIIYHIQQRTTEVLQGKGERVKMSIDENSSRKTSGKAPSGASP